MPIIKSAKKRMRQDEKRREYNKNWKRRMKTNIKKMENLIDQGKIKEAKEFSPHLISLIDKTAAKGVIHKNKACREKSKITKKLNKVHREENL